MWAFGLQKSKKIFELAEGYILPKSRFNVIDYDLRMIALHVRMMESPPEYEYYYDKIVILGFDGTLINEFYFRDLARFITDSIMGCMKHWKYFKVYFALTSGAFFTKKRYVMVFPMTYPRGLVLCPLGDLPVYAPHPEYYPQRKIPSGIFAFRLDAPLPAARDYEYDGAFTVLFGCDTAFGFTPHHVIVSFDQGAISRFEPIAVMPYALRGAYVWRADTFAYSLAALAKFDKSLLTFAMFAMGVPGILLAPVYGLSGIGENYFSAQLWGYDSGIVNFAIDRERFDEVVDESVVRYGDFPGAELLGTLEYLRLRTRFTLGRIDEVVDIFWHFGPPIWWITVATPYFLVQYPDIQYHKTAWFVNSTLVYQGDLDPFEPASRIITAAGNSKYLLLLCDDRFKLITADRDFKLIQEFGNAYYYWSRPFLVARGYGEDSHTLYLWDTGSGQTLMRYGQAHDPSVDLAPAVVPGGYPAVFSLKENGSASTPPRLLVIASRLVNVPYKELNGGVGLYEASEHYLVRYNIPGEVKDMVGTPGGVFLLQTDGVIDYAVFVSTDGAFFVDPREKLAYDWQVRKADSFIRFDKFLAGDGGYETIAGEGEVLEVVGFLRER